ncbi:hypothetical protein [Sphingomonas sp.]|uniref:hypothetical protein n=1 Tax=Sphingomonas sp. TaxID=28214 RepID=UPI002DD6ADF2|nr:hypothetical protein [Sphingomonas sp.]
MIALTLALAVAQTASAAPPQDDEGKTIVVTAKRLDVTKKALDACIARACPPDEEVAAALAHAENQFVEGEYKAARHTLHGTIGRVDRRAKEYPVAVANIWRAESRISAHLGEDRSMRSSQLQAIDALKAGLPATDDRVLLQRLQVADTFLRQGKVEMGLAGYHTVVRQARGKKNAAVEGTALLRIALVYSALAGMPASALDPQTRFGASDANFRDAKRAVKALLDTTDPQLAGFRDAGRLLDARLDAVKGDMRGIEAIAANYARDRPSQAILLYAPLLDDRGTFFDPNRVKLLGEPDFVDQWVDVTFLVDANGRVKEVEVLRESPRLRNDWVKPVLASVTARRYAPLEFDPGLDGMRRVERYTMTAAWGLGATGTNMRVRMGQPRLEMLDLTADPPRTASSGTSQPSPAE